MAAVVSGSVSAAGLEGGPKMAESGVVPGGGLGSGGPANGAGNGIADGGSKRCVGGGPVVVEQTTGRPQSWSQCACAARGRGTAPEAPISVGRFSLPTLAVDDKGM